MTDHANTLNWDNYRDETPSCRDVLHFNNAGASLMPDPVYQAVVDHLDLERARGGYEAAALTESDHEQFYPVIAKLLGANADEIAYVENATRAWDMAFYAIPWRKGDRILTHGVSYASNYLAFLQVAKRHGVEVTVVPSDPDGAVDVNAMESLIDARTKLIALTHIPSQGGLINPAAEVGALARKHKVLFLLDACQSAGQIPIDVGTIGCHMLSGTGRKFLRGPRGTGFLYVNNAVLDQLDPPFIDLHSATWTDVDQFAFRAGARRFENWESYLAGKLGLTRAAQYAMNIGLANIQQRNQQLAERLRSRLGTIPGVAVHDLGRQKSAIVTFTKEGEPCPQLAKRLFAQKINVSVSTVEYGRLDFEPRGLSTVTRASVHYFNTDTEIERFCEVVAQTG